MNLAGEPLADRRWTGERKRRIRASRVDSTTARGRRGARARAWRARVRERRRVLRLPRRRAARRGVGRRGRGSSPRCARRGRRPRSPRRRARASSSSAPGSCCRGTAARSRGWSAPSSCSRAVRSATARSSSRGSTSRTRSGSSCTRSRTSASRGPVNATAPEPVRNRDLARAIGKVLGRPSVVPAPGARDPARDRRARGRGALEPAGRAEEGARARLPLPVPGPRGGAPGPPRLNAGSPGARVEPDRARG